MVLFFHIRSGLIQALSRIQTTRLFKKFIYSLFIFLTLCAPENRETIALSSFSPFPLMKCPTLFTTAAFPQLLPSGLSFDQTVLWNRLPPVALHSIPTQSFHKPHWKRFLWSRSKSNAEHILASSLSHFVLLNLSRSPSFFALWIVHSIPPRHI